ncbi:VOC family protein [Halorubrum sp. GN11_10-6_MGM]|uniref:VOC family protein n=1 Tax=Halorubrum sp. GN11_10-6_MGM TaxID=2518112 RepID=UPI001F547B7C|nr:hypothetical protein [Halorubrum sp. GN11_10-6_MGM]
MPSADGDRYDHIAFSVDNVDVVFVRIDYHGAVKAPGNQLEAGVQTVFVKESDGHVEELIGLL